MIVSGSGVKMLRKGFCVWAVFFLCCCVPMIGYAQQVSGHLKYQPSIEWYDSDSIWSKNDVRSANYHVLDHRMEAGLERDRFSLDIALETVALASSKLDQRRALLELSPYTGRVLPDDDRRLLRLRTELIDSGDLLLVSGFDRGVLSYTNEALQLRLGRQAVSWGNGLSFSVLDVFNPFSPVEIDRDYKPGEDMALAQYLLPKGAELQVLALGRRDSSGAVRADESSFALRLSSPLSALFADIELVIASHYGEDFFGAGFSRGLANGVLRGDVALSGAIDSNTATSVLLNYDRSWYFFSRNVYAFVEYYHHGYGVKQDEYLTPSSALTERLERGEVFVLGEDYATLGVRVEWTPLLQSFTSVVSNLHDKSQFAQLRLEYDFLQDILVTAGLDVPIGGRDTEFGGVQLPESAQTPSGSLGPNTRGYLRIAYFF